VRVAVLSLCRDRLDYSRTCFASLQANAGCHYDHFVLDNGSADGTHECLAEQFQAGHITAYLLEPANVGIYRALNLMLNKVGGGYDVVVNFDNDCEVLVPDTLKAVCELAVAHPGNVIGPVVQGLRKPPRVTSETWLRGMRVGLTDVIGGIFMPIPRGWRYPEGGRYVHADGLVCAQARKEGGTVGQLLDYPVNHYETTDGQQARYPAYWDRRRAEGIPD